MKEIYYQEAEDKLTERVSTKQQYVEEMLKEVVKSFPRVKEDEIKIIYNPLKINIASYDILNEAETKKEPQIKIGSRFFFFTKEVQEELIAHEIGHHETMKDYSIPRLKRGNKWIITYKLNQIIPIPNPYWKERLKKWHILEEISADNKIAPTKYGKNLLDYYKNRLSPSSEIRQALIKNLEEKLGTN